jgi:hypothetical protein
MFLLFRLYSSSTLVIFVVVGLNARNSYLCIKGIIDNYARGTYNVLFYFISYLCTKSVTTMITPGER